MEGSELKVLRDKLGMSQQELAQALNQSFATINRWERNHRPIPPETARLLDCLKELLSKNVRPKITPEEIREAVKATGVSGVVAKAAMAGMLPGLVAMRLAAVPAFSWVGAVLGTGLASALPFFAKLTASTKDKAEKS